MNYKCVAALLLLFMVAIPITGFSQNDGSECSIKDIKENIKTLDMLMGIKPGTMLGIMEDAGKANTMCKDIAEHISNLLAVSDRIDNLIDSINSNDSDRIDNLIDSINSNDAELRAAIIEVGVADTGAILAELQNLKNIGGGKVNDTNTESIIAKLNKLVASLGKLDNAATESIIAKLNELVVSLGELDNAATESIIAKLNKLVASLGKLDKAATESIIAKLNNMVASLGKLDNAATESIIAKLNNMVASLGKLDNTATESIIAKLNKLVASLGKLDNAATESIIAKLNKLVASLGKLDKAVPKLIPKEQKKIDTQGEMQNAFSNISSVLLLLLTLVAVTSGIFGTLAAIKFPKDPDEVCKQLSDLTPKLAWHLNARSVDKFAWPLDSTFRLIYKETIYKKEVTAVYKTLKRAALKQGKGNYLYASKEWRDLRKSQSSSVDDLILDAAASYSEAYLLVQEYKQCKSKKYEESTTGSKKPTEQSETSANNNNYKHVTTAISLYTDCLFILEQPAAEIYFERAEAYRLVRGHDEDALNDYRMAYVMDESLVEARYAIIELEAKLTKNGGNNDNTSKA